MAQTLKGFYALGDYAGAAALEAEWEARRLAWSAHPLRDALLGVTAAGLSASEAPVFKLKSTDYGNGHREVCVWEHRPNLQAALDRAIQGDLRASAARGEGDRDRSIAAATRRAKQKVRVLAKSMCVNSLWTLTYRANVQDRALVLRHLDAFRRAVVGVLGEWRYIAVLERQERGAWHIHLATHALPVRIERGGVKVKSWDVMRAIWRRVVGDLGGNFDEAKRRKRWSHGQKVIKGAGAIASYIAGYVAKDMAEGELNKKRFWSSRGVEVPESYRALWASGTVSMLELIQLAMAGVGENITNCFFDPASSVFFVATDDTVPIG